MAILRYRAGGWDLRYRERSGKEGTERFRGGSTKRSPPAALERKGAVEAQLIRGAYVSRDQRETRFQLYYDRWAASRQISRTRRHTDDQRAAKHVLPYWAEWAICDIRPSDIDDWIAILAAQMGPDSVRHCYGILRRPLRRAIKDRIIENPCIDIALPKKPDRRKTFDDVLTAEEVDRLVDAIVDPDPRNAALRTNGRYRALVFMGCWLGPRWNEAIGLRVCDINPLRKELTFGRAVVNQNGNTTFIEKMSKTEDARTLPVPGPVMDVLLEHLRVYRPGAGREDNGKVSRAVVVDIEDITTESLLCRDIMHPFALGWQHDYVVARVEGQPILITRYFICPVWLPRHESSVTTNPRHQDVGAEARDIRPPTARRHEPAVVGGNASPSVSFMRPPDPLRRPTRGHVDCVAPVSWLRDPSLCLVRDPPRNGQNPGWWPPGNSLKVMMQPTEYEGMTHPGCTASPAARREACQCDGPG